MPGGEFLGRADVQHHRLLGVDQRGQLAARQAAPAAADLVQRQQHQQDDQRRDQQVVVGGEFDQTGKKRLHGAKYPDGKMPASIHSPI
ncbi:hypothetical protein D9M72_599930 [compost metagenome]